MSKQVIVGIGHYSRTGKDSLAKALLVNCVMRGLFVTKRSFAEKLKEACHLIYGWAGVKEGDFYDENPEYRDVRLPLLANEKWPQGPTVVELWIDFGTPAVRENVHDKTWILATLNEPANEVLIIPDVRFPNEVEALKERDAMLVKVTRPGVKPRPTSVADNALNDFDGWNYYCNNCDDDFTSINMAANYLGTEIHRRLRHA